ncbi:hypothetical protein ACVFI8_09440 [Agarivorans sp. MS3-6]
MLRLFGAVLLFWGFSANAGVDTSPLNHVVVAEHAESYLKLRNYSSVDISLDIYGQDISLAPRSGALVACQAFSDLEITVVDREAVFFSVPCSSVVTFKKGFQLNAD